MNNFFLNYGQNMGQKVMLRVINVLLLMFLFAPDPTSAGEIMRSGPEHTTEYWQGKVLTASFRAGMCFSPNGQARGVLILRHSNGNEDTYHLHGTITNGEFNLSHSSGHHFYGTLSDNSISGKAKLNRGITLSLKGKRTRNVPLKAQDCAPLN